MSSKIDFMSVPAAAAYIGKSPMWIMKRIWNDPTFPKRRHGQQWVIPRKPFDDYLDYHEGEILW